MGEKRQKSACEGEALQKENNNSQILPLLKKITHGYIRLLSWLFFIAVTVNFLEIIIRVTFNKSVDLFFDVPTWLNSWVMILASGIVLLENQHLSIDAVRHRLRYNVFLTKLLDLINNFLTLGFGLVLTYAGIIYVKQLFLFNTVVSRSINIPSWIVESCVPFGMGLFSICAIIKLVVDLKK